MPVLEYISHELAACCLSLMSEVLEFFGSRVLGVVGLLDFPIPMIATFWPAVMVFLS